MANEYYNKMKRKLAELEKANKELQRLAFGKRYQISSDGDPDCEHSFDIWELTSDSGIAFCDWTCSKCGMVVSQTLGERMRPEKVPKDKAFWEETL